MNGRILENDHLNWKIWIYHFRISSLVLFWTKICPDESVLCPGVSIMNQVMKHDIIAASKFDKLLDKKWNLWETTVDEIVGEF